MATLDGPQQVILVTSREEVPILGKSMIKEDITEVTWHTPLSLNPMMYGILLPKESFSLKIIRKANHFIVNFMPFTQKNAVHTSMQHRSEHVNKFDKADFTPEEADKVDAPRIKEAIAFLECELSHEYELGDHIMLVGKVLFSNVKSEDPRLFQLNIGNYTTTREA